MQKDCKNKFKKLKGTHIPTNQRKDNAITLILS